MVPLTYILYFTLSNAGNEGKASTTATTLEKAGIPTTESCVGYYADVEGDGTVDGVIYTDLAIGGSGTWGNTYGSYTIEKATNSKEYYISEENHSGNFGIKPVIAPKENVEGKNAWGALMTMSSVGNFSISYASSVRLSTIF